MPIERESTRLFREARRARRLGGGEQAASLLGQAAAKAASMEPTGIRKQSERIAEQGIGASALRQAAAIQAGYTPTGTRSASGNVLNARQNLFKQLQGTKSREEAEALFGDAQSLGVTRSGFDSALSKIGSQFDSVTPTGPTTTQPATTPPATTPPATTPPATTPPATTPPATATPATPVKTPLTESQKRMKFYENQRRSRLGLPPLLP